MACQISNPNITLLLLSASSPSRAVHILCRPARWQASGKKTRGLSVIDNRRQKPPVTGTPRVWDTIPVQGDGNLGIMLDTVLHPEYISKWLGLYFTTDRCWLDCGSIFAGNDGPVLRGRIKDNTWVDEK